MTKWSSRTTAAQLPKESNHNVLELHAETGQVLFSAAQEPPLIPGENDSTIPNASVGIKWGGNGELFVQQPIKDRTMAHLSLLIYFHCCMMPDERDINLLASYVYQ